MKVKLYTRPKGSHSTIECREVNPEDEQFFVSRGVAVSMEDIGLYYAVYADIGSLLIEGEAHNVMTLSRGRTCRETLAELRQLCEAAIAANAPT